MVGESLYPRSLRARYLAVAAGVVVAVLLAAWLAYHKVQEASRTSTANAEARNRVSAMTRDIRDAVWDAEHAIHAYLLSPSPAHRREVEARIAAAREQTDKLRGLEILRQEQAQAQLASLLHRLKRLEDRAHALMDLRSNSDRLYPGTRLMREHMEPTARDFLSGITLELHELDRGNATDRRARDLAHELRYQWLMLIAEFRALFMERTGAFGGSREGVANHRKNIEAYYDVLRKNLEELNRRHAGPGKPFSAETAERLIADAERWHEISQVVSGQAQNRMWRQDLPFLEGQIAPLMAGLWQDLAGLDAWVEESAAQDVSALNKVAGTLTQTIALLTVAALMLTVVGYFVFHRTVLRPLARVAEALRADAAAPGGERHGLPEVTTHETQQLVGAYREMRNQVQYRQRALEHQALHDDLSRLPNRTLLRDRLDQAIATAERNGTSVALLMMDLDRFKEINDTLGHQTGDVILKQVGERLSAMLRAADTVARLGGDEFAMLLADTNATQAGQVASKVVRALETAFDVEGMSLYVGGSIGIALSPEHGDTAHVLMQRADVAMYVAKHGNHDFAVYDVEQDQHSIRRLALVSDLRDAIRKDQLMLHYQPKLDLQENSVIGMEALLRWEHPELGMVPPDQIIPVAEQAGLIGSLTDWVLQEAIRQCARWRWRGLDFQVAVNLSVWNLQDPKLSDRIARLLADNGLAAKDLTLEITENAMMSEPQRGLETVHALHRSGIKIAVDDYGTGFSSLAYLKRLPVDELKIDKSFVMDMTNDENDAVIVRSTIDLAHNLGLRVVGEGVEDEDILDLLCILGCDTAQGFHIARPMEAAAVYDWLRAKQPTSASRDQLSP